MFVTVVIPTLNEARYIADCLRSLLDDPHPRDQIEVLVLDGGSTDGTVAIVEGLKAELPFLRVVPNPGRLQAIAFNRACDAADPRAQWIIRCDAHARYPRGFLSACVAAGERSGADLVVYADAPIGLGCFQKAVAFAQNSPIGVGNSLYRLGTMSAFVDHGKHGAFRRSLVDQGLRYDESFAINEDSELSYRIRAAGGRIWLDHTLAVGYYPRAGVAGLARQYYLYGKGRARTIAKHKMRPHLRQSATVVLLAANLVSLLGGLAWWPLWLFAAAYVAAIGAGAVAGAVTRREPCVLLSALAFAVMHHAWAIGYLRERLRPA
jgi:succinoglycan biosynthesis protein ExoA